MKDEMIKLMSDHPDKFNEFGQFVIGTCINYSERHDVLELINQGDYDTASNITLMSDGLSSVVPHQFVMLMKFNSEGLTDDGVESTIRATANLIGDFTSTEQLEKINNKLQELLTDD